MTGDRIKDLLHEVADGMEPGDRLDAIRAATSGGRRTSRGWWAAGGVTLVAASVVTALALTTGGTPNSNAPAPAEPASTTPTSTNPERVNTQPPSRIYFVGDTPDGPRLYSEFREGTWPGQLVGSGRALPLMSAIRVALGRTDDAFPIPPLDPDYRVPWPDETFGTAAVDPETGTIGITLSLLDGRSERLRDPMGLTRQTAALAVEQLIRTAHAVTIETIDADGPVAMPGQEMPVRFFIDGQLTDQVLGVPTSEPLEQGSDLAVLAHVSLSEPSEGTTVDNDEPFIVKGVGNSFEGNIVTRIQRLDGAEEIVAELPTIAGTYEDRLFPFEVTFDLTDVPPGDYLVVSQTDDPSGEGRFHTDDRRITVVD